jgi:hypothetical protein
MRKTPLAIFIGGLAVAVAVTLLTSASSNGEQPGAAKRAVPVGQAAYAQADDVAPVSVVVFAPVYGSSPRIIQVPQVAQANANDDEAVGTIDAEPESSPPVRRIRPASGH